MPDFVVRFAALVRTLITGVQKWKDAWGVSLEAISEQDKV